MGVLAPIIEAPVAETTEAPTSISEMPNIMGMVVPAPIEAMDTEREFEKGFEKEPVLASVTILEDAVTELVLEPSAPVLGASSAD